MKYKGKEYVLKYDIDSYEVLQEALGLATLNEVLQKIQSFEAKDIPAFIKAGIAHQETVSLEQAKKIGNGCDLSTVRLISDIIVKIDKAEPESEDVEKEKPKNVQRRKNQSH